MSPAAFDELGPFPHLRQAVFGSERSKLVATAQKERIAGDQKHLGSDVDQAFKSGVDVGVTRPT